MTHERLVIQKYGGSSLSTPTRIRQIAQGIARRAEDRTRIVVAVSAMGRTTDDLLKLAYEITPHPSQRELDMLLTVGERISMALLAMALDALGCRAISFTGSQSGIVTNMSHTRALIEEIRGDRIREELSKGKVVIVAGFQGVSREREITTLGRGGSDTSAVAIAAALEASQCEIYSDYPGVFTADPRWVASARVLPRISYDEMLELAALGARVLHYRAAEIARRYRVPLRLLSSFDDGTGTEVQDMVPMERAEARSITYNRNASLVRLTIDGDSPVLAELFETIGRSDIQIVGYHRESRPGKTTISIVLDSAAVETLEPLVERLARRAGAAVERQDGLATVSLVGWGFAGNVGTVVQLEQLLSRSDIPVLLVATSSMSLTCLVPASACRRAVGVLHSAFFGETEA